MTALLIGIQCRQGTHDFFRIEIELLDLRRRTAYQGGNEPLPAWLQRKVIHPVAANSERQMIVAGSDAIIVFANGNLRIGSRDGLYECAAYRAIAGRLSILQVSWSAQKNRSGPATLRYGGFLPVRFSANT